MNKAIIVYGPMACGKTRNADKIAAHYGRTKVIDEGTEGLRWNKPFPADVIVLTNNAQAAARHAEKFGSLCVYYYSLQASGVL